MLVRNQHAYNTVLRQGTLNELKDMKTHTELHLSAQQPAPVSFGYSRGDTLRPERSDDVGTLLLHPNQTSRHPSAAPIARSWYSACTTRHLEHHQPDEREEDEER